MYLVCLLMPFLFADMISVVAFCDGNWFVPPQNALDEALTYTTKLTYQRHRS